MTQKLPASYRHTIQPMGALDILALFINNCEKIFSIPELKNELFSAQYSFESFVKYSRFIVTLLFWTDRTCPKRSHKLTIVKLHFSAMFRLVVFSEAEIVVDTDYIVDKTLRGGRLGLYVFSQGKVIWDKLSYRCSGKFFLEIFT